MQIQSHTTADENPFSDSQRCFDDLTKRLSGREALEMTHGDLERLLDKEGRELIRRLFQDHVDLRGPGETEQGVVGNGGIRRPHARLRDRNLGTVFGKVTISIVDQEEKIMLSRVRFQDMLAELSITDATQQAPVGPSGVLTKTKH